MPFTYLHRAAVAVALLAAAGCTVKNTEAPPLAGPSGLALTLTVTASPDNINQDGGSQSSIRVTAIGPDGRPVSGLPLRMEIMVGDQPVDFGTLSARTVVTNSSGVASVIFTAPPRPPNAQFGTCQGLPGTCVSIVAAATGTNFAGTNAESVLIRLTPTGVIVPSSDSLVANFVSDPKSPVKAQTTVQFDATTSCGSQLNADKSCPGTRSILQYSWNFGDGQTASGKVVAHTYTQPAGYSVTLTITNDIGATASQTQLFTVTLPDPPVALFEFSPGTPHAGDTVRFVSTSTTPGGAPIVSYSWNFGDGFTCPGFCGGGADSAPNHQYPPASIPPGATTVTTNYNVILTVRDANNQFSTKVVSVPVITP